MQRKIVLIDMDQVISDITFEYIRWYKESKGNDAQRSELSGEPGDMAFPKANLIKEFLQTPGFFRKAAVIPGSQEVIKELNELFDVYIVSAAMEFPQSLLEKYDWLREHFPYITWKQIIFCGSKRNILGDVMIDDQFKHLDNFGGRKLLFTAMHNVNVQRSDYTRVDNWQHVKKLLVREKQRTSWMYRH